MDEVVINACAPVEKKPFSIADLPEMIYTELGLSGLLMAVAIIYLVKELFFAKKQIGQYKKDMAELVDKLHTMGIEMTSSVTTTNGTIEKLYNLFIKFLVSDRKEEADEDVSGS